MSKLYSLIAFRKASSEFKFKLKTGKENISIKLYVETVAFSASTAASPSKFLTQITFKFSESHTEAQIVDEAQFCLKENLLSLAHQERVAKILPGKHDTVKELKFKVQWVHNKHELRLKKSLHKLNVLEVKKERMMNEYTKAQRELETVQKNDGISVAKQLLEQKSNPGYMTSRHSLASSKALLDCEKDPRYLSFSDSEDEEVKEIKDTNTNCSSSHSKESGLIL